MPYLIAGVLVAVTLTVLNLVLTVGVIRRVREHATLLSPRSGSGVPDIMLGVGGTPDAFTARTTDGELVSRETLVGAAEPGMAS
jgi:hypothetical protein